MADDDPVAITPETAFDVLGEANRIAVIRTLADADGPLAFSDLRERVGMRDSGQFNYHLQKLLDRFVRKTDDGYELMTAGTLVHAAILSGAYTESLTVEPIELHAEGDDCPDCGATLEIRYEDEQLRVVCSDCDRTVANAAVPPGAIKGRDRASIPAAFGRYLRSTMVEVIAGFCPQCSGPMDGGLELRDLSEFGVDREMPLATFACAHCGEDIQAGPGATLLDDPDVIAFYNDHGRDLRSVPVWRLPILGYDSTDVVAEDPLQVAVSVTLDDERLTVTVDEDLTVVEVERTSA
jgi:hypothetical protein